MGRIGDEDRRALLTFFLEVLLDDHDTRQFPMCARRRLEREIGHAADLREIAGQLVEELQVAPGNLWDRSEDLRRDGQTVMYVVIEGAVAGLLSVADPVKHFLVALMVGIAEGLYQVIESGDASTIFRWTCKLAIRADRIRGVRINGEPLLQDKRMLPAIAKIVFVYQAVLDLGLE